MRSITGFNVVEALTGVQEVLKRHGGHPMAAGFVVATSDLPQVKEHFASLSLSSNGNTLEGPSVEIDGEIAPASLDKAYFDFIDSLSPFGKGNPDPVFLTKNVVVAKTRRVGKQRDHLKMSVVHDRRMWEVIGFRMGDRPVTIGDHLDLVYTPGLDEWGGRSTLQLTLLDLRPAR
jgi:single-stranded-DNA-specific exonuclease